MPLCEWCGHEHRREQLCEGRPKWSRRGFLSLFGVGLAGLVLAPSLPSLEWAENITPLGRLLTGEEVAAAWEAYVPVTPEDRIFDRHWLMEQWRTAGDVSITEMEFDVN